MRWFKHLLGNEEGNSMLVTELLLRFGPNGYYVFYRTLEIMCLEFDLEHPGENRIFLQTFYKHFSNIYVKTILKILNFCSEKYQETSGKRGIYICQDGDYILLKCNRLRDLADEYTKKVLVSVSVQNQESIQTNSGIDIDIDLDKERTKSPEPAAAPVDNSKKEQPDTDKKIRLVSESIYQSKKFDKVNAFVNWANKYGVNKDAILHCLERFYGELGKGHTITDPFAYCSKILKIEHGNYNEKEAIKKHEVLKEDMKKTSGLKVADLCKSIP